MKKLLTILSILIMSVGVFAQLPLRNKQINMIANGDSIIFNVLPDSSQIRTTEPLFISSPEKVTVRSALVVAKDSLVVTDASGADSIVFYDNGTNSILRTDNPLRHINSSFSGYENGATTGGYFFNGQKSRGTYAVPTIITTGDTLASLRGYGYDGANYIKSAAINFVSSGTVASTRVPSYMSFNVSTDAAPSVITERMRVGTFIDVGATSSNFGKYTTFDSYLNSYSPNATTYNFIAYNTAASSATNGGKIALVSHDGAYLANDHRLGQITFGGSTSATLSTTGAFIEAYADATWASNDYATRLVFSNKLDNTTTAYQRMIIKNDGKISLSGAIAADAPAAPTYSLSFLGTAAQTIGIEPNAATAAGSNLSINAGGNTAGGTADLNGGMLQLLPGASKGTGFASVRIQRNSRAATTGTVLNTLTDAVIIPSAKPCADNTSTTLFNVACAAGTSYGVTVQYTIKTVGGAGNESHTETGTLYLQGSNDGSVTVTPTKSASVQHKSDAGTYTVTFAASAANPSVISVTADSTLDVASSITYTIVNNDGSVITQL